MPRSVLLVPQRGLAHLLKLALDQHVVDEDDAGDALARSQKPIRELVHTKQKDAVPSGHPCWAPDLTATLPLRGKK
jgi:hypothetical protein